MGNAKLKDEFDGKEPFEDELEPGAKLMHGQYTIENFLNAGGFGITYAARDSLDRRVVIKECFPGAFCRRSRALVTARSRAHQNELASIVRLFVQEARSLAKLDHPNIVGVHQVFEENNTAYMALDFVEGRDLLEIIEDGDSSLHPSDVKIILRQVLDAVQFIHDQEILHRDISPDNILIDSTGKPVLIDFGAAREQATKQSRVLSALRVVKDGYSPQEFYIAGSEQGPYSDLYALGASFYHLLADELPPNSQARLASVASGEQDSYVPLVGRIEGYDDGFLAAIDKSLAILPKDRIASAEDWIDLIEGRQPKADGVATASTAAPTVEAIADHQPKSKKGLLLATAAAIGVVAVGVATQMMPSGADDAASAALPNIEATAPAVEPENTSPVAVPDASAEEDVAIAEPETPAVEQPEPAAVAEVEEAPAPIEEDVAVLVPQPAPAEAEDQAALAAPDTDAQPTPEIADEVAEEEVAPTPAPEVADAPVAEPAPEPEIEFADVDPNDVLTDAPGLEPFETAEVENPTATTSPRPPLRPSYDDIAPQQVADAVEPVELSTQTPQPVEVETSDPAQIALAETATPEAGLPDTGAVEADAELSRFVANLPSEPEAVVPAAVDTQPAAAIAPRSTGIQIAGINRGWSVVLPSDAGFQGDFTSKRIYGVNFIPVTTETEFNAALQLSMSAPRGRTIDIKVRVGADEQSAVDETWTVPVVEETRLSNGLVFATTEENGVWVTRASAVPAGLNLDMKEGDMMFGYLASSEMLTGRTSMSDILTREIVQGQTNFNFAIKRGDATWAVSFSFDGTADRTN